MSYPTMPLLPISMTKGLHKAPVLNTSTQKTAANVGNSSISYTPYPSWSFEFDMEKILGNENAPTSVAAIFQGTFIAAKILGGLFLFTDPQDSTVSSTSGRLLNVTLGAASPMSTFGDGSSTQFQLARLYGGIALDIIQNLHGTPTIYVNGVANYGWSISSTGIISFNPSLYVPSPTDVLTWAGTFQFLCRFDEDTLDATRCFTTNNGSDQWDFSSIKFSSEFV